MDRWSPWTGPSSRSVRARALMGELCPNGWQAQLTLYSSGQAAPPGAPASDGSLVAVDWSELPIGASPRADGRAVPKRLAGSADAVLVGAGGAARSAGQRWIAGRRGLVRAPDRCEPAR